VCAECVVGVCEGELCVRRCSGCARGRIVCTEYVVGVCGVCSGCVRGRIVCAECVVGVCEGEDCVKGCVGFYDSVYPALHC